MDLLKRVQRLPRMAVAAWIIALLAACEPLPAVPISLPAQPAQGEFRIALKSPDGAGARWNPCLPIRVALNPAGGPSFARAELDAAIHQVRAASGLDVTYIGTTTERPNGRVRVNQPRYGPGFAPVLVSFASPTEVPFASANASAFGQPFAVVNSLGRFQYVTGNIVLRPGHGWTAGVDSPNPLRLILQHELGHILGLAHVKSPHEIMGTAGNGSVRSWGPGDLRGLRAVGAQAGCLPDIPVG